MFNSKIIEMINPAFLEMLGLCYHKETGNITTKPIFFSDKIKTFSQEKLNF